MNTQTYRRWLATAAMTVATMTAGGASASSMFDLNGAAPGGEITYDAFSWGPSTWSLEYVEPAVPGVPEVMTLNFQGSLSSFENGSQTPDPGTEFTYSGSVDLFVTKDVLANISILNSISAASPGTFDIWYDTDAATRADNLLGTGFAEGTRILQAGIGPNLSFSMLEDGNVNPTIMDQFVTDNWAGQLTSLMSGNISFDLLPLSFDSAFFVDAPVSGQMDVSFKAPFENSDPSRMVNGYPINNFGTDEINDLNCGEIYSCDVIFQAAGQTVFETERTGPSAVPVPLPAVLLLTGLGALGAIRRRKKA